MTIKNYIHLIGENVTGPHHNNCFVAAVDCTSQEHAIPAEVYEQYTQAFEEQRALGVNSKRTKTTLRQVLQKAGGSSKKRVSEKRARTSKECEETLESARQGSRRVLIYTERHHVVGLIPVGTKWRMAGTALPMGVGPLDTFTSAEVFSFLIQPRRHKDKNVVLPNIITIDPEKKPRSPR